MPQLLVRDLGERIIQSLKRRAAAKDRSAEAEHRAILERALLQADTDLQEEAARLKRETAGRSGPDGVDIIRHFRETRFGAS